MAFGEETVIVHRPAISSVLLIAARLVAVHASRSFETHAVSPLTGRNQYRPPVTNRSPGDGFPGSDTRTFRARRSSATCRVAEPGLAQGSDGVGELHEGYAGLNHRSRPSSARMGTIGSGSDAG